MMMNVKQQLKMAGGSQQQQRYRELVSQQNRKTGQTNHNKKASIDTRMTTPFDSQLSFMNDS